MKYYYIYEKDSGKLLRGGRSKTLPTLNTSSLKILEVSEDEYGEYGVENTYFSLKEQKLKKIPLDGPTKYHEFDFKSESFILDIIKFRKTVMRQVSASYENFIRKGYNWNNNLYQIDDSSRAAIAQAAQAASLDSSLTFTWILLNNTTTVLTSADIIQLHLDTTDLISRAKAEKQTYREQIFSTYNYDELNAILTSEKFILT